MAKDSGWLGSPPSGTRPPPQGKAALAWARSTLARDPQCPDALRLKILLEPGSPQVKAAHLKALVERLEATPTEVAPRLRALLALAQALEQGGRIKDAVPVYERALDLAPEDPLEARYHLARCLLDLRRLKELRVLRERFPEDRSALLQWIRLLEIQKLEKQVGLGEALREARRANPHVEAFLTSRSRIPKHRQASGDAPPGSEAEALHILELIGESWFSDRAALFWLIKNA